ncbi:proton-conducting transporter transmembrane domain-containing protein [[Eubacterium] cellulosolvens]
MTNADLILLPIIIPLISAIIVLAIGRTDKLRSWISVAAALITLILVLLRLPDTLLETAPSSEYLWSQALRLTLSFKADGIGILFSLIAGLIGLLSILFSVRDLDGEPNLRVYYMWMLLFVGSMIGLVFSNDLITLFIFWELISLCSWGLIGFWRERPESVKASMKALLMTHISSLPLLLAIFSLYVVTGSFSIPAITDKIATMGASPLVIVSAVMFVTAIIAKSAQIPLHTWLPDAMEAPTPVSALLHSATMVKAGVFLAARMLMIFSPLFFTGSLWFLLFASFGVVSMTIAIHMALVEKDIKRVLAYSTVSHIGYMLLGIGVGTSLGLVGGFFHLLNHAVFKACLFLCAGSIIYRVGTRNIEEMGGLAKKMPITAIAFLIAALAASGVPPFNGFASKLLIYEATLTAGGPLSPIYAIYCIIAIYMSAITLAVFMKLAHSVFFGQLPQKFKDISDSPPSMLLPISLLAAVSVLFGIFPQLPVSTLILPILKTIGAATTQPMVTWLGYATVIGSYQATLIAILLALSFSLGGLIYLGGFRPVPKFPYSAKYQPMIGGEDAPIIRYEATKVAPTPFSQAMRSLLNPIYQISEKGGFDQIWRNLAKTTYRLADLSSRSVNSKGWILILFIILVALVPTLVLRTPLQSFLLYVGVLLMLAGAFMAIAQSSLKGFLAWGSASWIGRIFLEFGTATIHGAAGGILDIVNIILILLTLTLASFNIAKSLGTSSFNELGGLARKMPLTAGAFLISGLALAGIPPFSGWWSEYHLFMAVAELGRPELGFAVILASAFTISFILRAFNLTFYGKMKDKAERGRESSLSAVIFALTILCIIIGVYPDLIMTPIYSLIGGTAG